MERYKGVNMLIDTAVDGANLHSGVSAFPHAFGRHQRLWSRFTRQGNGLEIAPQGNIPVIVREKGA